MKQRTKILQFVTSLNVGGAEQTVLNLAERLNTSTFEIHVCSMSVIRNNALQPEFERLGVPLLSLRARRLYKPQTLQTVYQYVRQNQIDLIHTHLTDADVIGRFVARLARIPVVSTMQNVPLNYERQRRDRYWLERLTARYLSTHLVAVSQRIRDMYIERWHIPRHRISAIHNSVRMEPFLTVSPGIDGRTYSGPVITNVARLSPQKAQHILLAAAKIVLQTVPQARFMLVGQGSLEDSLKHHARELGISDNVIFTGVRHDIPTILGQSDVFVLSSLWEGLPLSAIEAMAAARPVVLTDVGGNAELIEPGCSGLLIPPDDASALAKAILALLRDESGRLAMGQAARDRARTLFSIHRFTEQYGRIYERLAGNHRNGVG